MNTQFPRFDLYAELGVEPSATGDEITAAWRSEVERARGAGPAAQRIQRLNTAHQWLGDATRRAQYDRELVRRRRADAAAAERQAGRPSPPIRTRTGSRARGGSGVRGGSSVRDGSIGTWPLVAIVVAAVAILLVVVGVIRPFAGDEAGAPSGSVVSAACPTSQPAPLPAGETRIVTIETSLGQMEVTVEGSLSPIAAGNFVALAACGFYDGVAFHRTASLATGAPFVIQGGDPDGTGAGGPGYTIQDEAVTTEYHRGTVAMARTAQPNSVGSQFFIVLSEEARAALESANTYQIIGNVTDGMDVADAIHAASGGQELPDAPVRMTSVSVSRP